MVKKLFYSISLFLMVSCSVNQKPVVSNVDFVDPFLGTAEFGHCMPNACYPFGLIQVGPQSGKYGWYYTAGYQFQDSLLYGFSQDRLNGTGCPDLGDLLMFPFSGDLHKKEYVSSYKKENEFAEPGYYSVVLDDSKVNAEMTATPHVAMHHYTYTSDDTARLLIDFKNGICGSLELFNAFMLSSDQQFTSPTRIEGSARTKGWLERTYYYTIDFSKPYVNKTKLAELVPGEKAPRYVFDFDLKKGEDLMVKVALSSESIEGSKKNMEAEVPGWNFEEVRKAARGKWNELLSRVDIEGDEHQKTSFYTAMYRLFTQPNNIADVDQPAFYSTLSLWDTYRAAHPLYTILSPEYVDDFVNSMLHQYDKQGFLPIWALWGGETYCMIGNHAVPVIVDAYLKGFRGFDAERAYEAVKTSLLADLPKSNSTVLSKYGYLPFDIVKDENVSRTLELSFDDYCASLLAKELGKEADYKMFNERSKAYKYLFDKETGLMRAKDSKGNWRKDFDKFIISHESSAGGDYTEGNAWQYTWHVQHAADSLIAMFDNVQAFENKLDSLFMLQNEIHGNGFSSDVTGLIGQYAHGNEPSHHVPYLYRLAGNPSKTEQLVNYICKTKYHDTFDGLCGNDDCGQMSAWYIFSTMGFYPLNPCGGEYVLGAPQVSKASLNLKDGKQFVVEAVNYSPDNIFVEKIEWNGKPYTKNTISHTDIMNGGVLKFYMTNIAKNNIFKF